MPFYCEGNVMLSPTQLILLHSFVFNICIPHIHRMRWPARHQLAPGSTPSS